MQPHNTRAHCRAVTGLHHQMWYAGVQPSTLLHSMPLEGVLHATHLGYTLHSINERLQKVAEGHTRIVIQSWVDLPFQTS